MKYTYFVMLMFYCCTAGKAQAPDWNWATAAAAANPVTASSGESGAAFYGMATDAYHNVYVCGSFLQAHITFGNTVLTNSGTAGTAEALLVAKYDPSGNPVWAVTATGAARASSISTDPQGNVYSMGDFGTDSITFENITLTHQGPALQYNMFIVKYNVAGQVQWAINAGLGNGCGISVNALNAVYVTGWFEGANVTIGNTTLTNQGAHNAADFFLAKYDWLGNFIWAKSGGDTLWDVTYDVSADAFGNAYLTGYSSSPVLVLGSDTLYNHQYAQALTIKYDTDGNVVWARNSRANWYNNAYHIATDAEGNAYIEGNYSSTSNTVFGNDTLPDFYGLQANIFLVKYDTGGNVKWVAGAGAGANNNGGWYGATSIAAGTGGSVYITGGFMGKEFDFGSHPIYNYGGDELFFLTKYDAEGNFAWVKTSAGNSSALGETVAADNAGNIYLAGDFASPTFHFDNITLTNVDSSAFTDELFIAKISEDASSIAQAGSLPGAINFFPHPSTGVYYFSNAPVGANIEIYNVLGEEITSTIVTGNIQSIHLSNQAKGIYFFRINDKKNAIATGKIILQ